MLMIDIMVVVIQVMMTSPICEGKESKATDRFIADEDDTHRICEVDVYIPLIDQEEN